MTAQFKSRVFKAGNSAAVRLPKGVAFALGTELTIQREGDVLTIKPARNEAEEARAFRAMLDDIDAVWAAAGGPPPREVRDPDIFPDRPGLY